MPVKALYQEEKENIEEKEMANVGERLVADYLRISKNCDFIDYNVYTRDAQGEIDVVGIDNKIRKVYICEVAIHLTTGLQYTKDKRPDTMHLWS